MNLGRPGGWNPNINRTPEPTDREESLGQAEMMGTSLGLGAAFLAPAPHRKANILPESSCASMPEKGSLIKNRDRSLNAGFSLALV
ncbi:hypothetical protein E4U14_003176 [Claviceps sp. LM454 group G7]|nr:hypothetical protein E4U14_003176 [Claviceps sp. LM454 group G7]